MPETLPTPAAAQLPRRTPTQQRSHLRFRAILDAARELIVEQGLDAVTTRAVADRARLPIGSVYYLFPDKYAIYRELMIEAYAKMQSLPSVVAPFDPQRWQTWFDDGLRELGDFYDRERAFAVLNRELRHVPGFLEIDLAGNRAFEVRIETVLERLLPRRPPPQRTLIARTCVAVGDRLLQESLEVDTRAERAAIVGEARRTVIAYLESHVVEGAPGPRRSKRQERES
jgi:AcrR family transcriptional regulator